jgi:vitamin B12 transporter
MKTTNLSLVASFLIATNLYSQTTLDEISITSATKSEQKLKDVTSNVDVITSQDIEDRKFKTVSEALNSLSGVSFSRNGGVGQPSSLYLRGMDSSKTLVLIDGIRLNDTTSINGADFSHFMINDIERIEVIKGAQSSIWGADASAGVINIITKSAQDGTHGSANIEYGRYNSKTAKATVSHKNKDFDVKLSALRVDNDGFSAISSKGEDLSKFEDDRYSNTSADLKLGYNISDNNRVSLTYGLIDAKTNYDNIESDAFWNTDVVASANSVAFSKTKTNYTNINYENRNDYLTTNIYANYSKFERLYSNTSMPKYDGNTKEYGIKTVIPYLGNSSFISAGVDFKEFEHKNKLNKTYDNTGIYISNTNKFFDDKTILTQSLRYDKYNKFDNKATGKIGLKQYIVDELNVSTNYGTGYNVPTIYQLFEPETRWGKVGNENLSPEKTKSYDVGVEYKGFSVTYFRNRVNNLINYVRGYENVDGNSIFKGVETAYKNSITENILLSLNHTYLSAKDSKEKSLLNRPENKFGFGIDYYGLKDFHFNINGEYIGTRYSPNFDYTKEKVSTGNYTIWNAVVDYDINKTFSTYLKLDNIFDRDYQIIDGYATSQRAAYVGLKASF